MSSATVRALAARHRPDHSWVWDGGSQLGLDLDDHLRLQRDALDASTAPDDVRKRLRDELDEFERATG